MERQVFDYEGEAYRFELEDGSDLLVSPEHNVYFKIKEEEQTSLLSKIKQLKDEMIKLFMIGFNKFKELKEGNIYK